MSAARILSRYPWHCRTCRVAHNEQVYGWYEGGRAKGSRMQCDACHDKAQGPEPVPAPAPKAPASSLFPLPPAPQGPRQGREYPLPSGATARYHGDLYAWFDCARREPVHAPHREEWQHHMHGDDRPNDMPHGWHGGSVARLWDGLHRPDPRVLAEVEALSGSLLGHLPIPLRKRRRTVKAEAGSALDLGAALAGDPTCWREQERRPAPRVVTLALNDAVSASVDATTLRWRGVALVALALWLQRRGVKTRIVHAHAYEIRGGEDNGKRYVATADISTPEQPLDMASVATLLAGPMAPATFRSLALGCRRSEHPRYFFSGRPVPVKPEDQAALGIDYLVPGTVLSEPLCRKWVQEAAARVTMEDRTHGVRDAEELARMLAEETSRTA